MSSNLDMNTLTSSKHRILQLFFCLFSLSSLFLRRSDSLSCSFATNIASYIDSKSLTSTQAQSTQCLPSSWSAPLSPSQWASSTSWTFRTTLPTLTSSLTGSHWQFQPSSCSSPSNTAAASLKSTAHSVSTISSNFYTSLLTTTDSTL